MVYVGAAGWFWLIVVCGRPSQFHIVVVPLHYRCECESINPATLECKIPSVDV